MLEKVNHKSIVLAREAKGLTQNELASLLEIDQGHLSKIEQGLRDVPPDVLERLSSVLEFPTSFFLDKCETYSFSPVYFRKRKSLPVKFFTQFKANLELRRFHIEKLLASAEIETDLEFVEPDFKYSPEDIARYYRHKWKISEGAISNLVEILEDAGIIVVKLPFNHDKLDGITFFTSNNHPIIYINYETTPDRMNFNLAHELGHLIMHINFAPTSDRDTEKEAHRFASEFLMPEAEIKPFLKSLSLKELADLKRMWNVSMAAILYKAHDLKTISDNQYTYLNIQLSKAGYKINEPLLGLKKHEPYLLNELFETHINELDYSKSDLADLLKVNIAYLNNVYFGIANTMRRVG
jgi:Zn-dependent peptidase ImmA (M78 family)/plasmid maintenance system antidote protein VapI